jgi:flagellar basal body-associated protein FliL
MTVHKKRKYILITLLTLVILAGGAVCTMYFTKSVFFAVPPQPTTQPKANATPKPTSVTADYKTAIPTLSNQADADYIKAQSGSSN